jgi:TPP-dependent pyruvate/acetoin dehydrogenase alpha subunit
MREQSADLREFMREQTLLSQRRLDRLHEAIMAEIREFGDAMRQHHERQDRKLDDVLAENRAQREALFRMLDRLDGGGATPPA